MCTKVHVCIYYFVHIICCFFFEMGCGMCVDGWTCGGAIVSSVHAFVASVSAKVVTV